MQHPPTDRWDLTLRISRVNSVYSGCRQTALICPCLSPIVPDKVAQCNALGLRQKAQTVEIHFNDSTQQNLLMSAVFVSLLSMTPNSTAQANVLKCLTWVLSLQTGPATHSPDTWVRYEGRQRAAEEILMCWHAETHTHILLPSFLPLSLHHLPIFLLCSSIKRDL